MRKNMISALEIRALSHDDVSQKDEFEGPHEFEGFRRGFDMSSRGFLWPLDGATIQ